MDTSSVVGAAPISSPDEFSSRTEAISATSGLGYRIFLVRRYLSMDVILPYVAWITLLAFGSDYALRTLRRRRYAWIEAESVA